MNGTQDPLGYGTPLPFERRYYPMGFPLDLSTNSGDILTAADALWAQFPPAQYISSSGLPQRERVARLRVIVAAFGSISTNVSGSVADCCDTTA